MRNLKEFFFLIPLIGAELKASDSDSKVMKRQKYWLWDKNSSESKGPYELEALLLLVSSQAVEPDALVAGDEDRVWIPIYQAANDEGSVLRLDSVLTKEVAEASLASKDPRSIYKKIETLTTEGCSFLDYSNNSSDEFYFPRVKKLGVKVARCIKTCTGSWYFPNLEEITEEEAWQLSNFIGKHLDLSGPKNLSFVSWCYFSNSLDNVWLDGVDGCPNWFDPLIKLKADSVIRSRRAKGNS